MKKKTILSLSFIIDVFRVIEDVRMCSKSELPDTYSEYHLIFFLVSKYIVVLDLVKKYPPRQSNFCWKMFRKLIWFLLVFLARNISLLWLWLKGTSQDNWISVGSFPRSPPSLGADNCMLCSSRKWFGPNLYVRSPNYFLCIICSEISAIFMQSCLLWIFLHFLHRLVEVSSPAQQLLESI